MSLDIANIEEVMGILIAAGGKKVEGIKGQIFIFVGWFPAVIYEVENFCKYTRSYLSIRIVLYTPRVVKYQRWSRFFNIISVDMWICFALSLVLGCHYSQPHFKLRAQITLAPIQVLQQHFQCHNQYYSRLTVSVCKHTAALCTATSILLLLGVLQCCDQHSVPGVPHNIPYRTRIPGTYQNSRANVKIRKAIRFP